MLHSHGHGSSASMNHRSDGTKQAYQPAGAGSSENHQSVLRLDQGYHPDLGRVQAYQPGLRSDDTFYPGLTSNKAYQPRPKPNQAAQPSLRPTQGYQPQPGLRTKQTVKSSSSFNGDPLLPQKSFGSLKNPSQRPIATAGGRRPILLASGTNVGWQAGSPSQYPSRAQGIQRIDVSKIPQGATKGSASPWRRTSGSAISDRRRLHVGNATPLQMVR